MAQTNDVLCWYKEIAQITQSMRTLAQQNEWEQVLELAPKYHNAVQELRKLGNLSVEELSQRQGLLLNIIENDAEVRRLAEPQLDNLNNLINNLQRQRTVLKKYYEEPQQT